MESGGLNSLGCGRRREGRVARVFFCLREFRLLSVAWRRALTLSNCPLANSTPANFLPSTGVLTTTTPLFSSPSPFAALLSASDDLETSLANGPTFDTVEIRQRLVYRPVTLTEAGKASEKIEVDELSDGSVMRRRVWETKSGVMVPDG